MTRDASNASIADAHPPAFLSAEQPGFQTWMASLLLQIAQRFGAISFLVTISAWVMLYLEKDVSIALAIVAGTAQVGLAAAMLARIFRHASLRPVRGASMLDTQFIERSARQARTGDSCYGEGKGVAIFNLVLLVLALQLMLFTRMHVIHSSLTKFFTSPSDPSASQPMDVPR